MDVIEADCNFPCKRAHYHGWQPILSIVQSARAVVRAEIDWMAKLSGDGDWHSNDSDHEYIAKQRELRRYNSRSWSIVLRSRVDLTDLRHRRSEDRAALPHPRLPLHYVSSC